MREANFDLILMDVQITDVDGFEATLHIRHEQQSTGMHAPIVATTAHIMTGDRERCLQARNAGKTCSEPCRRTPSRSRTGRRRHSVMCTATNSVSKGTSFLTLTRSRASKGFKSPLAALSLRRSSLREFLSHT
jgi:CheY-like chemotaxis protein